MAYKGFRRCGETTKKPMKIKVLVVTAEPTAYDMPMAFLTDGSIARFEADTRMGATQVSFHPCHEEISCNIQQRSLAKSPSVNRLVQQRTR